MPRRAVLSFGLLAVIFSLLFSAPSCGQSPEVPNRCTQPPDQTSPRTDGDNVPHRKVVIERIIFDGPIHLDNSAVAQIVATANRNEWFTTDNAGWVEELAENWFEGYLAESRLFPCKGDGGTTLTRCRCESGTLMWMKDSNTTWEIFDSQRPVMGWRPSRKVSCEPPSQCARERCSTCESEEIIWLPRIYEVDE